MSMLGEILTNIIGPILLVVGIAFIADRKLELDSRALSRLLVYVFTPFLIFKGVAYSDLSGDEAGQLIAVAALMSAAVAVAAWLLARQARFDRQMAAFTLARR